MSNQNTSRMSTIDMLKAFGTYSRFKDRIEAIEQIWTMKLWTQYNDSQINLDNFSLMLRSIVENPLIIITDDDVEFDKTRISQEQVIGLMANDVFEIIELNLRYS